MTCCIERVLKLVNMYCALAISWPPTQPLDEAKTHAKDLLRSLSRNLSRNRSRTLLSINPNTCLQALSAQFHILSNGSISSRRLEPNTFRGAQSHEYSHAIPLYMMTAFDGHGLKRKQMKGCTEFLDQRTGLI